MRKKPHITRTEREKVALAIAQGEKPQDAAAAAGVSHATGWRIGQKYAPLINKIQAGQAEQFRRILQKGLDRLEKIVNDPKSERREVMEAASLAAKMVAAGDRIGLMARAVAAKEREVDAVEKRPAVAFTIEELAISIAKDRGLLPAPAEPAGPVIDVDPETGEVQ